MLRSVLVSLCCWLSAAGTAAAAETWPSRPIELIHGFGAGGQADILSRMVAQRLSDRLGVPVIVAPRTGAGGNLASETVTRARPDGNTLILLVGGHAVSAALYRNLKFDPVKDFTFVSPVSVNPFVFVVRSDSPVASLADLVERARREPEKYTYSSVGVGSTQHLIGELFGISADARLMHVPYRGGGAPMMDLIGGQIDLNVDSIAATRSALESGRARALGVTSAQRWPTLPDVPAVAETVPGFAVMSWTGIAAPAGTPEPIVERLNAELQGILAEPEFQQALLANGSLAQPGSPADLKQLVEREIARWNGVINQAGIERN